MEKLRSLNYLNDETFARDWARSKAENRGYGPERIAQELKTKGIPETLARQVVGEVFVPGQEVARAKMLLDRRFKDQQFNDPKTLRRAISLLQRLGYGDPVIAKLLKVPLGAE